MGRKEAHREGEVGCERRGENRMRASGLKGLLAKHKKYARFGVVRDGVRRKSE